MVSLARPLHLLWRPLHHANLYKDVSHSTQPQFATLESGEIVSLHARSVDLVVVL